MKKLLICLSITSLFSLQAFSQIQIDSAGNAGIGIINPSSKLDVDGVIKATGGNSTEWNNKLDVEVDADTTNELQQLNLSGDTIFISNGNYILVPNLSFLTSLSCSITSSFSKTDETFSGAKDGSISITASCTGFCGPIQYALNGGAPQAGNVFAGLSPGIYTVVVSNDGVVCSDTNVVTILAGPPPTVQQRLDTAETPIAIFNSGIPLISLYGKTYQGGLIFYLNTTTGNGLVAAPTDQGNFQWDNGSRAITGATGQAIGIGQSNTSAIVSTHGASSYAATVCDGLTIGIYSDWFLPSKDEINEMYVNLKLNGFGSFNSNDYWSSTETNFNNAVEHDFSSGLPLSADKGQFNFIRACRAFSASAPSCLLSSSVSKTDETISGANDGSITVTATCSGFNTCTFVEYSLNGGAPQSSNIFSSLAPGTYTIVASNVGVACSDTNIIAILSGPLPTIQQRLDTAETPIAIFNSGAPLDSLYGKTYQGGLIFYLDTITGNGFLATATDQANTDWNSSFIPISTGASATSIGSGQSNTNTIISSAQGGSSHAALVCDGLNVGIYSDWFLPSRDELNAMYVNLHLKGLGSFSLVDYWSSSEAGSSSALARNFSSGSSFSTNKGNTKRVRACRDF